MKPLLLIIFTFTLLTACTKNTKKIFKTIEKAQTIQLFAIEDFATAPAEQNTNETYILDYKILNQIPLSDSQQVEIKTYISNPENYTKNVARTCSFMAQYGLSFFENGKEIKIIISNKNCPKCLVSSKSLEEATILDFVDEAFVKGLEN